MAPEPRTLTGRDPDHPDGAPPGAHVPDTGDRHAFDADGRADTREAAPITIGGTVYHRRRKNWEVTREMRRLLRVQERAGGRRDRLAARIDALTEEIRGVRDKDGIGWAREPITDDARIEDVEAQVEALENDVDAATDDADEAAYALIALLLRGDGDDGTSPPVDVLKSSLDVTDAGDLAASLAGGGEPDPTPTSPSS